jgi:hypothetical protein
MMVYFWYIDGILKSHETVPFRCQQASVAYPPVLLGSLELNLHTGSCMRVAFLLPFTLFVQVFPQFTHYYSTC